MSGKAKAAAQYTEEFCCAIIDGLMTYLEYVALARNCGAFHIDMGELYGIDYDKDEIPFTFSDTGWCIDDVRGGELPMELVREGREAEMKGFASRRVYEVRPRSEATAKGAKVVGVRWVDTLKGGKARCRLVCQDFNNEAIRTKCLHRHRPC